MPTLDLEFDLDFGFREEGVVLAATDVVSGVELGAALAYQDVARDYNLTAKFLDAQPFGL